MVTYRAPHACGKVRRCLLPAALALGALTALPGTGAAERLLFFEDFTGDLGDMTAFVLCGSGGGWAHEVACPSSPGAPSPNDHARFGLQPGCGFYSSGDVNVILRTPMIDTSACTGYLTLRFSYFLDFEDGPAFDRARVEVGQPRSTTTQVASNGTVEFPAPGCSGTANELGTSPLFDDGAWHELSVDLSALLPTTSVVVRFVGETTNGDDNAGQGFLVDDVELTCGEPGDEIQVNNLTVDDQYVPALTMEPTGDFVVVWQSSAAVSSIRGQRFLADGSKAGNEFQVNSSTFRSVRTSVAGGILGNFVVVWNSLTPAASEDIYGQLYNSDGTLLGGEFQVNTYTTSLQERPAVAADTAGNFVVVWQSNGSSGSDSDSFSIQGRLFQADGTPASGEFQVNTYTTNSQLRPSVAANSGGDFVVVWDSKGSSGSDTSDWSIQGQRFDADGIRQGSEFQVNTYTTGSQLSPSLAIDASGDFVVVWESEGSSGSDTSARSIQGQRYFAFGAPQGGQFQVNSYTTDKQGLPSVALDNSGDFFVVWQSHGSSGSDNSEWSIQGQRFRADGTRRGAEFQINAYTSDAQERPKVATDGRSQLVVWDSVGSFGSDNDSRSIQYRNLSLIFADGFESGDLSAWSSALP